MPRRTHDGLKKRCAHTRKTWADCACPWWFGFYRDGREYRYSLTKLAHARGEKTPRSKDQAVTWRDRLRAEIRDGTFVDPDIPKPEVPPDTRLTFGDVCELYLKNHVRTPTRRAGGRKEMTDKISLARRAEIPAAGGTTTPLEQKPFDAITKADIEAVRTWRREQQAAGKTRPGAKGGEAGTNRLLSRLRHLFNWAIAEGFRTDTPFKLGPVTVVKLETSVEGARTQRLSGVAEEHRLLAHADPFLRAVLVAALSTGCRIGEILSLQWSQIRRDDAGEARWIVLPAAKTKTAEARVIPVGSRLRAELSLRQHGPDGEALPATAYVFGTETGERVRHDPATVGRCRAESAPGDTASQPRQADGRVACSVSDYQPARPRFAPQIRQPTPRVVGRPARRAALSGPRGDYYDKHLSAQHAGSAGARAGKSRGRRRIRTPFAHAGFGRHRQRSRNEYRNAS